MLPLKFEVPGQAIPQGSKVAFVVRGRAVMKDDNEKEMHAWRNLVAGAAELAAMAAAPTWQPVDGPVLVRLLVFITRPAKSKFLDYPAGPPDTDKLQRAIGDALTQSKVITDDARIVQWIAGKRWTGGKPFIAVKIEAMPALQETLL